MLGRLKEAIRIEGSLNRRDATISDRTLHLSPRRQVASLTPATCHQGRRRRRRRRRRSLLIGRCSEGQDGDSGEFRTELRQLAVGRPGWIMDPVITNGTRCNEQALDVSDRTRHVGQNSLYRADLVIRARTRYNGWNSLKRDRIPCIGLDSMHHRRTCTSGK